MVVVVVVVMVVIVVVLVYYGDCRSGCDGCGIGEQNYTENNDNDVHDCFMTKKTLFKLLIEGD